MWPTRPTPSTTTTSREQSLRESARAAAPPDRRRLQRLVDVHDPARGRRGARAAAAAVHQVGRRRLRAARRRATATRRSRCPAPRSGTWPGATRTTPSTGRPTSTCATGWWSRALHSPNENGGGLFRDLLKHDLRFLITLQYSTVQLHLMAYRDFLAGPDKLFDDLPTSVVRAREERTLHSDGRVLESSGDLPLPSMSAAETIRFRKIPTQSAGHRVDPGQGDRAQRPPVRPGVAGDPAAEPLLRTTPAGSCLPGWTAPRWAPPTGAGSRSGSATRRSSASC